MALSSTTTSRRRTRRRTFPTTRPTYNYELLEYPAEETHGLSVFYKDAAGDVFHTYSSYARGVEMLANTYNFLDMAPKGRDEAGFRGSPWLGSGITTDTAPTLESSATHNVRDEETA